MRWVTDTNTDSVLTQTVRYNSVCGITRNWLISAVVHLHSKSNKELFFFYFNASCLSVTPVDARNYLLWSKISSLNPIQNNTQLLQLSLLRYSPPMVVQRTKPAHGKLPKFREPPLCFSNYCTVTTSGLRPLSLSALADERSAVPIWPLFRRL